MLTAAFALFLLAASLVGLFVWLTGRGTDAATGKAVAEDNLAEAERIIKDTVDANKIRDEISRDYAAGKPRRMRGKYDID